MACIRNQGSPWQFKGVDYQDAYLVIDDFAKYDKQVKQATYYVDVYASETARDGGKDNLLKRYSETCNGDNFDTYFAHSVIDANGNHFRKAYQHLAAIETSLEDGTTIKKYDGWSGDE